MNEKARNVWVINDVRGGALTIKKGFTESLLSTHMDADIGSH